MLRSAAVFGVFAVAHTSGISAQRHVAKLPPGEFFWEPDISRPLEGEFEWNPERSAQAPITILGSAADQTIYVYRNGIPIGRAAFKLDDPARPLGGHPFIMLEGFGETPSTFVAGRPAHRWMAVRTGGKTTLEDLGRRIHLSQVFAEKVYDIVSPGTTVVVTDAPALRPSASAHAVFLMEAAKQ